MNATLGLNDVAILMPYVSVQQLLAAAPSPFEITNPAKYAAGLDSLPADGKAFIPAEVVEEISKILVEDLKIRRQERQESLGLDFVNMDDTEAFLAQAPKKPQNYRLSSIRIDPCSNYGEIKSSKSDCVHEVRVVWQFFELDHYVSALGSNFHSIYQLDDKTFTAFVKGLRDIRAKAGAAPLDEALSPHPVIAREGPNGNYFKGLVGLMHRYLRVANLRAVSFHDETGTLDHSPWWKHWAMTVVGLNNGKIIRIPPPGLAQESGKKVKLVQRFGLERPEERGSRGGDPWQDSESHNEYGSEEIMPSPVGSQKDSFYPTLANARENALTRYRNAFLVQNPMLHNRNNTDCMSCHSAEAHKQNAREALEYKTSGEELKKLLAPPANAFVSKSWNTLPSQVANYSRDNGTAWPVFHSLQMFSYQEHNWVITPHVINDAALSAELIKDY